jgi:thioredoxin 1
MTKPTTDDTLKTLYNGGLPILLLLHAGNAPKTLTDALAKLAKKHGDALQVAMLDTTANPKTAAKYTYLELPAVVTFEQRPFGVREKSEGEQVRPSDLRDHAAFLLGRGEDPAEKAARKAAQPPGKQPMATPPSGVLNVSDKSFKQQVLRSKQPVLVDFWAPWCGPCRQVSPMVEQLGKAYKGKLRVVKVNVDDNPKLSRQYQVSSIPTLMIFEGGQMVERAVGARPHPELEAMIKRVLTT